MKILDLTTALSIPKLSTYIKEVEYNLDQTIKTDNRRIASPLRRLIRARSKRLRPAFIIAVAVSQGQAIDQAIINCCTAIELLHIASLIHDDIMDNAASRWGKPTINSREGYNQAILIGDYLFGKAYTSASLISQDATELIGTAMVKLCDGQSREIGDQYNLNRSIISLSLAHRGKTAALFETACRFGAICSGLKPGQIEAFATYGENFGMAFQLIDDLLDLLSAQELIGKPVGNDIAEGIYTMPVLLALKSGSVKRLRSLLKQKSHKGDLEIADILFETGAIAKTIDAIKRYNALAAEHLEQFKPNPTLTGLQQLPATYSNWAIDNLVAKPYRAKLSGLFG